MEGKRHSVHGFGDKGFCERGWNVLERKYLMIRGRSGNDVNNGMIKKARQYCKTS